MFMLLTDKFSAFSAYLFFHSIKLSKTFPSLIIIGNLLLCNLPEKMPQFISFLPPLSGSNLIEFPTFLKISPLILLRFKYQPGKNKPKHSLRSCITNWFQQDIRKNKMCWMSCKALSEYRNIDGNIRLPCIRLRCNQWEYWVIER